MSKEAEWTKEAYDKSLSSTCWWYTGYCRDGESNAYWSRVAADDELRQLVAMEQELSSVPDWAARIAKEWITYAPPCGHCEFPNPFLRILDAIGSENAAAFRPSCYCVPRERKKTAMDYCLCLDAWLAGATPVAVALELTAISHRKIGWQAICTDLWNVLGGHTEKKELAVELTLHALRHAVKSYHWDDDQGDVFGRDQYLGDVKIDENGNMSVSQKSSLRRQRLKDRLKQVWPEWKSEVDYVAWWLCAPKAFRFLERDLWAIGKERLRQPGEEVPGFLGCEDTYPNQDESSVWYHAFCLALADWWQERPTTGPVAEDVNRRLKKMTPVKRWLVRLLLKKIRTYESNGEQFTHLVKPDRSHKRGTKPIVVG